MPSRTRRVRRLLHPRHVVAGTLVATIVGAATTEWIDPVAVTLLAVSAAAGAALAARRHGKAARRAVAGVVALTLLSALVVALAIVRWSVPETPVLVQRTPAGSYSFVDTAGAASLADHPVVPTHGVPLEVLGFVASDFSDSTTGVDRDAAAVSEFGATGVTLGDTPGTVATLPNTDIVLRAHVNDARGYLVVSNYDAGIDDFNGPKAEQVIADAVTRSTLAGNIAAQVRDGGWDGVVLDLEALDADARVPYVQLTAQVKELLGDASVVVATPADGHIRSAEMVGYDLAGLARAADRIVLMAYDQHGPGTRPGPVASLDWVKDSLTAARAVVPADKLLLGIAGYGYSWAPGHDAVPVTFEQVSALEATPGAVTRFDPVHAETVVTLPNGTQAWYSDKRAFAARATLAAARGLAGVALWRVGAEQPDTLSALPGPPLKHPGLPLGDRPISTIEGPGVVALTFDDGPDPAWTPQVLDILEDEGVPGTFFVIGKQAEQHPELVRRMVAHGDVVGNHTYSHPNMNQVSEWRARWEILRGRLAIAGLIGADPALYRSPYGNGESTNGSTMTRDQLAATLGQHPVNWTDDPQDWADPGVDTVIDYTLAHASQRTIVLLHDGGGDRSQTIAALPTLIRELKAAGYTFATVDAVDGGVSAPYVDHSSWSGHVAQVVAVGGYRFYRAFDLSLRWVVLVVALLSLLRLLVTVPLALTHARRRRRVGDADVPAPSVTVVVPAHNEEAVLAKALTALTSLPAGVAPAEVIVVDDGSTDATAEVAARFAVRLIRQVQAGKAHALNTGIASATSDVVVVIDADTLVTEALVPALAEHFRDPQVGAVAGNVKVGNRSRLLPLLQAGEYLTALNLDRRAQDLLGVIAVVPGAAGAFRRTALADVGGYPDATLVEDADLTVRLLRAGWQIRYEPAAVAWTEAPQQVRDVLRQRRRWAYGTLQVLHQHADAFGGSHNRRLGWIGLPWTLLAQVLLPLAAPLADLYLLRLLIGGSHGPVTGVLALAATLDVAIVASVVAAEREDWRLVAVAPLMRWVWRPLLVLAVVGATRSWVADRPHAWVASRRYASVLVPTRRRTRPHPTAPTPATSTVADLAFHPEPEITHA